MRRILICTGILGGGTALTFVAAALAASLLPGGTVLPSSSMFERGFGKGGPAIDFPVPVDPAIDGSDIDVVVVDGKEAP
jgi:hypothetical protein